MSSQIGGGGGVLVVPVSEAVMECVNWDWSVKAHVEASAFLSWTRGHFRTAAAAGGRVGASLSESSVRRRDIWSLLRTGPDTSGVCWSPQQRAALLWAVMIRNTGSPPQQWVLPLKWGVMTRAFFTVSSLRSPSSIPSVVVTTSTSANPQQSGGTRLPVARLVSLLPDVQADCVEPRPCRRRRTRSVCLDNKICSIINTLVPSGLIALDSLQVTFDGEYLTI